MTSSRASSWHRDRTHVSCRQIVYHSATWQVLVTDKTVAEVPSNNPTSLKPQTPTTASIAESSLSVNEPTVLPVTFFFFFSREFNRGKWFRGHWKTEKGKRASVVTDSYPRKQLPLRRRRSEGRD